MTSPFPPDLTGVPGAAGAPTPFAIDGPPRVELDASNAGTVRVNVTNLLGRPTRARIVLKPAPGGDTSWFRVAGQAEVPIGVSMTAPVDIAIAVPKGAPAGESGLTVEVVAEDDTEAVASRAIGFAVRPGSAPAKVPVGLIIGIVVFVLLLGGGVAAFFVLRSRTAEPEASPTPAASGIKNTSAPKLTGDAVVGSVITLSGPGSWTPAGLSYSHKWQRCRPQCNDIAWANGDTYTLTADDIGNGVRVMVTATAPDGTTATAPSNTIGPVKDYPDACIDGYTWRLARDGDHVCVLPATRDRVAADNAVKESRWVNGAYGPHTCLQGYVWREAFDGDDVCTTGDQRTLAKQDNAAAASRVKPQ